jgi:hypothetical protein
MNRLVSCQQLHRRRVHPAGFSVLSQLRMSMICLGFGLAVSPARCEPLETRLAPSPLTDGTRVNISGEGRATANLDDDLLTVSGEFHGLATPATTAEVYDGLGIGILGDRAFDLAVTPAVSGTIAGRFPITAKQAAAIRHGHFYVQINSVKAPDGNLTGWLLPPHLFAGEDVPVAGHGFLPQLDVPGKDTKK